MRFIDRSCCVSFMRRNFLFGDQAGRFSGLLGVSVAVNRVVRWLQDRWSLFVSRPRMIITIDSSDIATN